MIYLCSIFNKSITEVFFMLLAILGSPRKQSNTTVILQKILTECSKEGFNTKHRRFS
jgi:multimeric flavodoxin WrbA